MPILLPFYPARTLNFYPHAPPKCEKKFFVAAGGELRRPHSSSDAGAQGPDEDDNGRAQAGAGGARRAEDGQQGVAALAAARGHRA